MPTCSNPSLRPLHPRRWNARCCWEGNAWCSRMQWQRAGTTGCACCATPAEDHVANLAARAFGRLRT
eukprot:7535684-Pyramimonas_sp.AAC.1